MGRAEIREVKKAVQTLQLPDIFSQPHLSDQDGSIVGADAVFFFAKMLAIGSIVIMQ